MASAVLTQEQFLVDFAQWLARVQQYSATHPACAKLGEKAHASLERALEQQLELTFGILKDNVMIGEVAAAHPAIKTRIAPYLHERGVLVVRFSAATSLVELTALVDLLTIPVQATFDRGGLGKLAAERGVTHIHVEELTHDISAEEREAQRRRRELRVAFVGHLREMLADRGEGDARSRIDLGEELVELLERPDVAVAILEEDPLGVAEAVAGLCLMVRQAEEHDGAVLFPKLEAILLALSPPSHDRMLLGFPPLVGDFRAALAWALDRLDERDVGRMALPALRRHTRELDAVFYALAAAIPHDGRRRSIVRWLALGLYDLPADDPTSTELLEALVQPASDFDSAWSERTILGPEARRALSARLAFAEGGARAGEGTQAQAPPAAFDGARVMTELVKMASRTRRFDQLCAKLPRISAGLADMGETSAVMGVVRALREITRPELRELSTRTLQQVASSGLTAKLLAELDAATANLEGDELEELASTLKVIVELAPAAVFDRLEASEARKTRRILIEALASGGRAILPLVQSKLTAPAWFVVRNAVVLVPRVGGTVRDLEIAAQHPNEKVRLEVLRSLRSLPTDAAAMQIIGSYLTDPSIEVRRAAWPMLRGELLGPPGIATLEAVASDEKQPEELRARAIDALGRSPLDVAAAALFRLIQPRGLMDLGTIRDHAALALRKSPAPSAASCFEDGLKSSVWRVRKACERAAAGGTES